MLRCWACPVKGVGPAVDLHVAAIAVDIQSVEIVIDVGSSDREGLRHRQRGWMWRLWISFLWVGVSNIDGAACERLAGWVNVVAMYALNV